jgi:hypothetical protein
MNYNAYELKDSDKLELLKRISFMERHGVQEQMNYKNIDQAIISETAESLRRSYNRRYLDTVYNKKSQGIPSWLIEKSILYINKVTMDDVPTQAETYYYNVGKFLYRLANFYEVFFANWGEIDDHVMFYLNAIDKEDFPDYVKNLRAYSFRYRMASMKFQLEEWEEKLNSFEYNYHLQSWAFNAYDDILPEDYLINWINTNPTDFFETQKEPPKIKSEEVVRELIQKILYEAKPGFIQPPDVIEILQNSKESSSYVPLGQSEGKTTSLRTNLRKNILDIEDFIKDELGYQFKRCQVPVSPGNQRDTFIASLRTRCSIFYFDRIVGQILRGHPLFMMVDDVTFERRLNIFLKDEDAEYFMLDVKKSQLTFSHEMLRIICDELTKAFPPYDFNKLYRNYKLAQVWDPETNTYYSLKRGTGLGMLNNLYSFCWMIILTALECKGMVYNDDMVGIIPRDLKGIAQRQFLDQVMSICESTGMEINRRKRMISRSFVFLEEYYKTDIYQFSGEKYVRPYMAQLSVLFSSTYREIKEKTYANMMADDLIHPEFYKQWINNFRNIFGPEWTDENGAPYLFELYCPPNMGGFGLGMRKDSPLDYTLVCIEEYIPENELGIIKYLYENDICDNRYRTERCSSFEHLKLLFPEVKLKESAPDHIKKIYDRVSYEKLIKQLEESLDTRSIKRVGRIRRLEFFRRNENERFKKLSRAEKKLGESFLDFVTWYLNIQNEELDINVALPKSVVEKEHESIYTPIEGYNEFLLESYKMKKNEKILSILYNKGYLEGEPLYTGTEDSLEFIGCHERLPRFSYKGKTLDISEVYEYVSSKFELFSTFGSTPEAIAIEYICRENRLPERLWIRDNPVIDKLEWSEKSLQNRETDVFVDNQIWRIPPKYKRVLKRIVRKAGYLEQYLTNVIYTQVRKKGGALSGILNNEDELTELAFSLGWHYVRQKPLTPILDNNHYEDIFELPGILIVDDYSDDDDLSYKEELPEELPEVDIYDVFNLDAVEPIQLQNSDDESDDDYVEEDIPIVNFEEEDNDFNFTIGIDDIINSEDFAAYEDYVDSNEEEEETLPQLNERDPNWDLF